MICLPFVNGKAQKYWFFYDDARLSIDCIPLKTHNIGMEKFNVQVRPEKTPNPHTMKFNFGVDLLENSLEIPTAQDAEMSPLAKKLFGFPWTSSVYLGASFISITKQDWVDWEILTQPLCTLIESHINNGEALISDLEFTETDVDPTDSPVAQEIKKILKQQIRPVLAYDGGDVQFIDYNDGTLTVRFKGACSGCPSKSITLKQGIEARIKELIPEVREVIGV